MVSILPDHDAAAHHACASIKALRLLYPIDTLNQIAAALGFTAATWDDLHAKVARQFLDDTRKGRALT